jgi:hypothetical protein
MNKRGSSSYFSNQCPRTFAPKPRYALGFWAERDLTAPKIDVLDVIRTRARHFLDEQPSGVTGILRVGDARADDLYADLPPISCIVTSPPYYGMRTYRQDQWLRNWFLGGPSTVDYASQTADLAHSSPESFVKQLADVWTRVRRACKRDAMLVVRFGGIQDRKCDPVKMLKDSLRQANWRLVTLYAAGTCADPRVM